LPSFITNGSNTSSGYGYTPFGGQKFLWGNMPALDVLNLKRNEGPVARDWRILFAGMWESYWLAVAKGFISFWRLSQFDQDHY